MRAEDLKCFEFECGETDWVIARNKEEAVNYYKSLVGNEIEDYEVKEIENWHDLSLRKETHCGWKDTTFLEDVKESYNPETFEPYIIATTYY
ncbi:MAG: hypothetical protein H0Z24_07015 [Thermosipho sp. (in: Bacteria)]|nr:hypothetical protein [Thermosipho sp. (in: thermotogales)]